MAPDIARLVRDEIIRDRIPNFEQDVVLQPDGKTFVVMIRVKGEPLSPDEIRMWESLIQSELHKLVPEDRFDVEVTMKGAPPPTLPEN